MTDWREVHNVELKFCNLNKIAGDTIEKNEMGGACSTYGGRESCVQGSGGEA